MKKTVFENKLGIGDPKWDNIKKFAQYQNIKIRKKKEEHKKIWKFNNKQKIDFLFKDHQLLLKSVKHDLLLNISV